ncbi:pilus assembly PilX family protein [Aquabacterium sp.]|uniref:pilus assembly PilX family protein n=1 Tax=Aquabacterium sp. TaxID=1872578 RepID=UPI002CC694A4|nr:pilus assembly PilX N-terminal domain-containing protein [Aquabacterium sp.]HSW05755.1 pilus assembly PilX N-terminal domain-containing protein [Aquabacterium sp.]
MTARPPLVTRRAQQGVATLLVTMLLLFIASLGALYVNRGVLSEQRSSGNQMQATLTHEVAEAAIEWATGMINSPADIGADCKASSAAGDTSFRKRYVMTGWNGAPASSDVKTVAVFPGCKINPADGTLTCSCPATTASGAAAVAAVGTAEQPGFTMAFETVAGDTDAVKVTAWACPAQSKVCSSTEYATGEGHARLSVTLKLGLSPRPPAAPLTCGTSCDIGGSFNVENTDVATNGILVNAGTSIDTAPGTSMVTLSGQPTANALIENDQSLYTLASQDTTCEKSSMFKAYFGMTIERFRDSPTTKVISCGSTSDCKSQIDTAYNQGWRSFYFSSDLQLSGNNTYGTQADPIIFVTPNAIKINGDNTFYGLIFSNSADWNDIGTGSATIYGAQVTCAAYKTNGNGTVSYDPDALNNARRMSAPLVRVPGSWRDFKTNTDTQP